MNLLGLAQLEPTWFGTAGTYWVWYGWNLLGLARLEPTGFGTAGTYWVWHGWNQLGLARLEPTGFGSVGTYWVGLLRLLATVQFLQQKHVMSGLGPQLNQVQSEDRGKRQCWFT
jgi:hypothetical protein